MVKCPYPGPKRGGYFGYNCTWARSTKGARESKVIPEVFWGPQEISRHDYLIKWHLGSAIFGHTNIYDKSLYGFYDNTEYFETT